MTRTIDDLTDAGGKDVLILHTLATFAMCSLRVSSESDHCDPEVTHYIDGLDGVRSNDHNDE